ncbi:hypothetical protein D3C76_884040 [compost metagenome]
MAISIPGGEGARPLGGDAWMAFLTRSAPFPLPAHFAADLFTLAYAPSSRVLAIPHGRIDEIFQLSQRWIGEHHVAV